MAEETTNLQVPTGGEAHNPEPLEVKGPTIEDTAREQGWNPDYTGPDKIDAAEYVRRKPLFDKIHAQGRELKEIKRSVDSMVGTYKSMSEAQYQRGVKDAEKRMAEAEASFNVVAYKEAAADKAVLEQSHQAIEQATPAGVPPEVEIWCNANPWFDKDKIMQTDALEYKDRYVKRNPSAPLNEVLAYVEARIKKDYPEKFPVIAASTIAKSVPTTPPVEGGGSGSSSKSGDFSKLESSMTQEEKRVMAMFTASGKMSKAEYLKSYAEVREM